MCREEKGTMGALKASPKTPPVQSRPDRRYSRLLHLHATRRHPLGSGRHRRGSPYSGKALYQSANPSG